MSDLESPNAPDGDKSPRTAGRNRYILVLLQSGMENDPFGDLDRFVVRDIQEKLDAAIESSPDDTEIDVWLESPGGDAHATYKLFLDIRDRCAVFRAIIPDYAKSAATLLVLGADEIWMSRSADLGPLDAQIEHPDREGVTVSALDVAKSMGYLADFAVDYLRKGGLQILRSTGLPRAEVLQHFSRFAASLLEPIVSKLDPHLLYKSANELDVASRYAQAMIRAVRARANGSSQEGEGDSEQLTAEELAANLVAKYPSHGFVISRKYGKALGLPVFWAEEYNYWAQVKDLHRAFYSGTFSSRDTHSFIRVLHSNDLPDLDNEGSDETEQASNDACDEGDQDA